MSGLLQVDQAKHYNEVNHHEYGHGSPAVESWALPNYVSYNNKVLIQSVSVT